MAAAGDDRPKQFEDLRIFVAARLLTRDVYRLARVDTLEREHALSNQLLRSAISIVSNIAEGYERGGYREFLRFLAIAKGSCGELRAQLHLVNDLRLGPEADCLRLQMHSMSLSRQIARLMQRLRVLLSRTSAPPST